MTWPKADVCEMSESSVDDGGRFGKDSLPGVEVRVELSADDWLWKTRQVLGEQAGAKAGETWYVVRQWSSTFVACGNGGRLGCATRGLGRSSSRRWPKKASSGERKGYAADDEQ